MCAIYGAIIPKDCTLENARYVISYLSGQSTIRGRDGQGLAIISQRRYQQWPLFTSDEFAMTALLDEVKADAFSYPAAILGNCRAEPTTEWVPEKADHDQQPYHLGRWTIVHNGTIANDKELRTGDHASRIDSAAIVESLDKLTRERQAVQNRDRFLLWDIFRDVVRSLKGSYAILAVHDDYPDIVFAACNYRPLYVASHQGVTYFASSDEFFPSGVASQAVEPYTMRLISADGSYDLYSRNYPLSPWFDSSALVVLSGGLDSTVALAWAKNAYAKVTAVHFRYGARPAAKEEEAVRAICAALEIDVVFLDLGSPAIFNEHTSNLLNPAAKIAGGEEGAEFAHEWVPARNLLMLATATAYAEANKVDSIILGNNMEEAGAYPDNEPELYKRFNDLLPFAVGAGKRLSIVQPVGNLMKHEIVRMGLDLGAPLHLTWSCYHKGALHCGKCGPCYMRRKAFEINGETEVIKYEE